MAVLARRRLNPSGTYVARTQRVWNRHSPRQGDCSDLEIYRDVVRSAVLSYEATMTKSTGLSILLLLAPAQLPAQSLPADSLFDRLIGHWVLRGTIARQATIHDVTFDWILGRE